MPGLDLTRSNFASLLILLASAGCSPRLRVTATPQAGAIAIEHVSAIPMDGERVLQDQTILIRDGRIESVTPSRLATLGQDVRRIDATGLYAIPGIADMHTHPYDTEGFPSYFAYGITTIAVMHGSAPVLDWRQLVRSGRLEGPTIYSASPSVNGYPPGNPLFISVQDTAEARRVAREQKQAGYDFIKAYSFLNPDMYAALLDEANRVGIPVVGPIPWQVGTDGVLKAGQRNVAHVEEFFQDGDIPDDSMPVIARRVKNAGVTVTANLFAYADYLRTIASIGDVLSDPEMRFASPAQYSEKIPTSNRATSRSDLVGFAKFLRERRVRFQMFIRALSTAGVPILVGTDTETFGFPGQSAYLELLELVEAGLTPYQALEAGTRNAGDFVRTRVNPAEQFGQLVPGMRADVVLLRANPLADIRNASSVAGLVVRGKWYPPDRVQKMRDSISAKTTPERRFVFQFDSLMMIAKDAGAAAALLRQFRTAHPTDVPLAELVWRGYGRMLYATDKPHSTEIRRMAVEVYPRSYSAHNELGRALLFAGDTAAAEGEFRTALALSPHNFVYRDMLDKLAAAHVMSASGSSGAYLFEPVSMKVHGHPQSVSLRLAVTRAGQTFSGRVFASADTGVVADEVVVGNGRIWASATLFDQPLELRLEARGDNVTGTWVLGWANNGAITGKKQ